IVAERTVAQLERMLEVPIGEAVVASMDQVASEADRERVRDVVRDVVYPADSAFLETVRGPYLAATRTEPGIWSAPNGEAIYRSQVLHWTSLDLDPREVHDSGVAELEEIEAERREIAEAAGFGEDTVRYRAHLASDAANVPQSRDALVQRAQDEI